MIYTLPERIPNIHKRAFIAPNASIIGSVHICENASIWFNAVLRGDTDQINIGRNSNVQDNCVLHTDHGLKLIIGEQVTVGHSVTLHGCKIGDFSLVGIGSTILNRARIGQHCLIAANTLITEDKIFPDQSLIMGAPGKVVRTLNDNEIYLIEESAWSYVKKIELYRKLDKSQNLTHD